VTRANGNQDVEKKGGTGWEIGLVGGIRVMWKAAEYEVTTIEGECKQLETKWNGRAKGARMGDESNNSSMDGSVRCRATGETDLDTSESEV